MDENKDSSRCRDAVNLWKQEQCRKYTIAFLTAGLDLLERGITHFGSDDVPEEKMPDPRDVQAIPGTAIKRLLSAHVIEPYMITHAGQAIHMTRKNRHKAAHGRPVGLYRVNRALAEEWCRRNGVSIVKRQTELFCG